MDYDVREFKLCFSYAKETTHSIYFCHIYAHSVADFMKMYGTYCLNVFMLPSPGVNSLTPLISVEILIKIARTMLDSYLLAWLWKKSASLLWCNVVKAILWNCGLRKINGSHSKVSSWFDRYEFTWLNASSWCSLSKQFKDFSMQDILLNWQAKSFSLN